MMVSGEACHIPFENFTMVTERMSYVLISIEGGDGWPLSTNPYAHPGPNIPPNASGSSAPSSRMCEWQMFLRMFPRARSCGYCPRAEIW